MSELPFDFFQCYKCGLLIHKNDKVVAGIGGWVYVTLEYNLGKASYWLCTTCYKSYKKWLEPYGVS